MCNSKNTGIWSLQQPRKASSHDIIQLCLNGQRDMRVEVVDVLMIDVGCADVTWSHAWNSVWVSSYHHFLVVCGWLVNIMRGSRGCWFLGKACSVLCSLLPWSLTEPLGAPQLYWPQATPRHPGAEAKTLGLIYSQQYYVLCRHPHPSTPPAFLFTLLLCLSVFFSLLFLVVRP